MAAPGVLVNDVDADGDGLSAVLVTGPSHGLLTLNPDGSFVYSPETDWHGTDAFTYRASDGQSLSAPATVTIEVHSAQNQIEDTLGDVQDLVDAGVINNGNGNALTVKLQGAIDKLHNGKLTPAVNQLNAFINQVNVFISTGELTSAQRQPLIDAALAAIDSIQRGVGVALSAAGSQGGESADGAPVQAAGELVMGIVWVRFEDATGVTANTHRARLDDALATLNSTFAPWGVVVGLLAPDSDVPAHVHVRVDTASPCGGAADAVLGCAVAGEVTLIAGWAWHTAADTAAIPQGQYDFQTIVTHELGHSLG